MNERSLAAISTAAVVGLIAVIVAGIGIIHGLTSADGGTIIAVRNGGWFDSHDYRQAIQPGSSLTWAGWWSAYHPYPAAQRNFKVSARPDADSNETINVPTKDGVSVGIEGTFYFELTRDEKTLGEFDDKFGTRTYPIPGKPGESAYAWDDDQGWNAFLGFTIGNLVQNDLRREVSGYSCADLISSCALAQNGAGASVAQAAAAGGGAKQIQAIQDAINKSFASEVATTLGGAYFTNIKFTLAKVALPDNVQNAINDAQAAFAGVTKSQAGLQQAQIDAQTNAARQAGYNACATCADIDRLKALPPGLTTYAPGAQFAVGGH